ncbi:MAG: EVE domain-containing protein [Myxococcaceae bacterium]
MAKPNYWIIKSEPSVYPYSQLQSEKRTNWTGIRSFEARNNLRGMKKGDLALYYHSGEGKEIVGVARIVSSAVEDPTAPGEDWSAVDVEPVATFKRPVTLATVKKTAKLKDFKLVTRSRLSVAPVTPEQFELLLKMGETKLPR